VRYKGRHIVVVGVPDEVLTLDESEFGQLCRQLGDEERSSSHGFEHSRARIRRPIIPRDVHNDF
jgi:hypothetical protein